MENLLILTISQVIILKYMKVLHDYVKYMEIYL